MDLFFGFVALFLSFFLSNYLLNFNNIFVFFILKILFSFINLFFFLSPFPLSRVADRVLVLGPGVRPKPLRWERRVQDIDPPKTSQPNVISNGESSPRDLHLNAKTQLH